MEAILFSAHTDESNVLQVILQQAGFMVRTYRSLDQAIEVWSENPADYDYANWGTHQTTRSN